MRYLFFFLAALMLAVPGRAQTLTASNARIEWEVVHRFRFFQDPADFLMHERAWRQYLIHARNAAPGDAGKELIGRSSVTGTEHMLNDRYIPFSRHLRSKYDWRGWAARMLGRTCWNEAEQDHSACGGKDAYLTPSSHRVALKLSPLARGLLLSELNCEWRVGAQAAITAPCDEAVEAAIPWPVGATVSVNIEGEQPISREVRVRDLLIAGLGDSFASGEGNPDVPVVLDSGRRTSNLYPARMKNDGGGDAQWTDENCHRSLYGHQLRAALQVAIENPQAAVTFLGYACSGATIEDGILGAQNYVAYESDGSGSGNYYARRGGKRSAQLYRLMNDLCSVDPEREDGIWQCPGRKFHRSVDFLLLSAGGNDIGFSSLVGWATLRSSASATLAKWMGSTVSPGQFGENMQDDLPGAYADLAKALETAVPLSDGGLPFDASRVVLTSYPDILADETGAVCRAGEEGDDEAQFAANQSLDVFSSWLVVTERRLSRAHEQLAKLDRRMGELAEDHGWTFAGRAHADRPFKGHGFCARDAAKNGDPAEVLRIPCWSRPGKLGSACESSLSSEARIWQPFDPMAQNYPYALRQRWVRTFNDAYMIMNQKVLTRSGAIDVRASASAFSETTGAMHPTAEGHAAMADAMLMDLRTKVADVLALR